ncbi:MAG: hypothetical protein ACQEXJ_23215 [Myxococcota bacterium]
MSLRMLALCSLLIPALAASACDDDGGGGGVPSFDAIKDTSGGQDTAGGDALPDVSLPDGAIADWLGPDGALPDVDAPEGTVKALQIQAEETGCNPDQIVTLDDDVSVTGVIVTSPKFDAFTPEDGEGGLDGYYVTDPGQGPWAGITLTVDRAEGSDYQPGDVLDVQGSLVEAWCSTQIQADTVTEGEATDAPQPMAVDPAAAAAEPYEGTLVRVEGVEVLEEMSGGVYGLTGGLVAGHAFDFFLSLDVGATYDLTGQVTYAFGQYRIMPRSEDDIVLVEPGPTPDVVDGGADATADVDAGPTEATTISALQQTEASTGCTEASIQGFADGVEIEGVVVTPRWVPTEGLYAYGIADGEGPWSGVVLTVPTELDGDFEQGRRLRVVGEHLEFYCNTQFDADADVEALDIAASIPGPTPVTAADLEDPEPYEGVVVEIHDVTVTANGDWDSYREVETDAGVWIDATIMGDDAIAKPEVDTTYTVLRGLVRYEFGTYRIAPLSPADLSTDPVDPPEPGPEPTPDAGSAEPEADAGPTGDAGPMPD